MSAQELVPFEEGEAIVFYELASVPPTDAQSGWPTFQSLNNVTDDGTLGLVAVCGHRMLIVPRLRSLGRQ